MTRRDLPDEIDTAIIGGGIVGLSLGLRLAERDLDVALLDDGRHAGSTVNAGSLHVQMQSRFIQLYPEAAPGVEAALPVYVEAVAEWFRLADRVSGGVGLDMTGGFMVAESDEQLSFLTAKCAREKELGLEVEMLDRSDLDRVAPYLGPAVIGAELCHNEGKVNPLLANQVIRTAAIDAGARCFDNMTVSALSQSDGAWNISVGNGTLRAGRIVIAAGARSASLVEPLGIRLPMRSEPLHMNITAPADPIIGHLVQHADRMITLKQLSSGHVVIGGGWPSRLTDIDRPLEVLETSTIGNISLSAHVVPAIAGLEIIRTWAGVNPSLDGLCVLGETPDHPGLYFAIGGDAGYTLGPLVARLTAEAIAGEKSEINLLPYSVARFAD